MDIGKRIRENFEKAIADKDNSLETFEYGISEVAIALNQVAPNAANFQLLFDLLYWDWTKSRVSINPKDLDKICLKYSKFGEAQEHEIKEQQQSAEEWAKSLEESGISPMEALGLAKSECEFIVEKNERSKAIASHQSDIAVPLEICRLMRQFYRADKIYKTSTTNVLKPLLLAKEVMGKSSRSTGEELKELIVGRIVGFMKQVRGNTALGRWVIPNQIQEIDAITEFADFIVFNLLDQKWNGDKSRFASVDIRLIEDAVYYLYILEQDEENSKKQ